MHSCNCSFSSAHTDQVKTFYFLLLTYYLKILPAGINHNTNHQLHLPLSDYYISVIFILNLFNKCLSQLIALLINI